MQDDKPTRTSEARYDLDFESEDFRQGEASGLLRRFCRRGVRMHLSAIGGSGVSDVVRYDNGVEIDVNNFVLPSLRRRVYLADEPLILLRASLSCDVVFKQAQSPPIFFNRPELTLVCMPRGMEITVDGIGGVRQQGVNGIFRSSALVDAYGLSRDDVPQVIQDALGGGASFGRVVSLPLDHRVANLVADTIDSPLEGEMRALQYAGRMAELVAYMVDAIKRTPPEKSHTQESRRAAPLGWRAADLAQLAMERLTAEYRKPPLFADLAKQLGSNSNKLQMAFKAAYGITMAEYCLERRMREAQQLLLEGKLSIAEVAERVGYAHQSNFAAAFSGHLGMSPREYMRHRAPINLSLG